MGGKAVAPSLDRNSVSRPDVNLQASTIDFCPKPLRRSVVDDLPKARHSAST